MSGDHIVFFDPHTSHVPRATTNKPGLKLKFTQNAEKNTTTSKTTSTSSKKTSKKTTCIKERFKDQFLPYEMFGNDMKTYYNGTLFRLPLRTDLNSNNDEIKRTTCDIDTITKLLEDFQRVAVQSLLFLRNVSLKKIYFLKLKGRKKETKNKKKQKNLPATLI